MSAWVLLIDGYNVIGPVAAPGRGRRRDWLADERDLLLSRLTIGLNDAVRRRTCVVFDARNPPSGRSDRIDVAGMSVRFAVDYPEADDLLEELIAAHSSPKSLTVVSSDHRVQAAAKRRKATVFESQAWLDELLMGRVRLVKMPQTGLPRRPLKDRSLPEINQQPVESLDWQNDPALQDWMDQYGS